jgi:hypothetical protein
VSTDGLVGPPVRGRKVHRDLRVLLGVSIVSPTSGHRPGHSCLAPAWRMAACSRSVSRTRTCSGTATLVALALCGAVVFFARRLPRWPLVPAAGTHGRPAGLVPPGFEPGPADGLAGRIYCPGA